MNPALLPDLQREASVRASIMVASPTLSSDHWEDLRQEMIVDCLHRAKWFDPSRGEWKWFVRRVMVNRSAELFTEAGKRARREIPCGDLAGQKAYEDFDLLHAAHESGGSTKNLELRIDVERILAGLPESFQHLARQLGSMKVVEICTQTGQPRARIYRMIRRLRNQFKNAGLCPPGGGRRIRHNRRRKGEMCEVEQ